MDPIRISNGLGSAWTIKITGISKTSSKSVTLEDSNKSEDSVKCWSLLDFLGLLAKQSSKKEKGSKTLTRDPQWILVFQIWFQYQNGSQTTKTQFVQNLQLQNNSCLCGHILSRIVIWVFINKVKMTQHFPDPTQKFVTFNGFFS